MKKYLINILAGTLVMFSVWSCGEDGFLSQKSPSSFDSQTIFSNYTLARSAVDGAMLAMLDNQCYALRYKCFYGLNTDIEVNMNVDVTNNGIQRYLATPDHQRLNASSECFSMFYQAIERINLALDGLKNFGNMDNNKDMHILYAQLLTLRAHIYCDMTRAWGDVPARFVPVAQDDLYKPKANRDVIFKHILDDLDEAIPILPYPGEHELTKDAYHMNKAYAAGLFARIALMASGYALRPDDDKIGTGDPGTIRLSSDPEMAKSVLYPRALSHLEEIIKSEKVTLAPDYKEYWRMFNNSELAYHPTVESLFVVPYGNSVGRWNYTFALRVDNGDINGYKYSLGPFSGPAPNLYFDFDKNDKRRQVTCANYLIRGKDATLAVVSQWYFSKFRTDQMIDNPYTGVNTDGVKPVAMRYADILLMAAEIENELGHLDIAKKYFKPVRARAFDDAQAEAYLATLTSKEAFFNAIVDERAFEFCGEQVRKADLIRWNMLKAKMDETRQKLFELRDRTGRYSYLPADIYYRINPDNPHEMQFYGYDGETDDPGAGWTKRVNHFTTYGDDTGTAMTSLNSFKINSIYGADPDTKQFWPIPENAITNSQGHLVNDYGY
ncbi:MAG: RagB/SusD family nutrient uptake outer membrane protein [Bacteroidales bacterium]|nr:RagB/SusD family nutrient uptake outer membrane protein [Bacteroidales bacterium]